MLLPLVRISTALLYNFIITFSASCTVLSISLDEIRSPVGAVACWLSSLADYSFQDSWVFPAGSYPVVTPSLRFLKLLNVNQSLQPQSRKLKIFFSYRCLQQWGGVALQSCNSSTLTSATKESSFDLTYISAFSVVIDKGDELCAKDYLI